jgi:hypothetical protein
MPATATILNISCLRHATGTDAGVNQALADLAPSIPFEELGGISLLDFVTALPGVLAAVDSARSDPDNLYMTAETSGGLANAIWPPDGTTVDMQAGQSRAPGVTVPVSYAQNISLFDHDWPSGDDLLGSVSIFESELGAGELSKLAKSDVESSYYYITYRVD